jgi:hypothetical protein
MSQLLAQQHTTGLRLKSLSKKFLVKLFPDKLSAPTWITFCETQASREFQFAAAAPASVVTWNMKCN